VAEVKVSRYWKKGKHYGFRKFIDGRWFMLAVGIDNAAEQKAKRIAAALLAFHKATKGWTTEGVARCYAAAGSTLEPSDHPPIIPATVKLSAAIAAENRQVLAIADSPRTFATLGPSGPCKLTIYQAIENFKEFHEHRAIAGEISWDQYESIQWRIDKAREGLPDGPLNSLGRDQLTAARQYFTSRPVSNSTGRAMAVQTVVNVVKGLRKFITWIIRATEWVPPKFWEDTLKFNAKKLRNPQEKRARAKGFANFTLTELQVLWQIAMPYQRLFMGLGFWCGWTQNEIATLLQEDVQVINEEVFIDRLRHKTEVRGRWWLPPEVGRLLLAHMEETPANRWGLALLGANGLPLVHRGFTGRRRKTDSIKIAFSTVRRHAKDFGINALSFKYFRKTASQLVRDKLGLEYAQLFSAQTTNTVADKHYNSASMEKLTAAAREIYKEYSQIFQRRDLGQMVMQEQPAPQAA
jgi:hypothetical protein